VCSERLLGADFSGIQIRLKIGEIIRALEQRSFCGTEADSTFTSHRSQEPPAARRVAFRIANKDSSKFHRTARKPQQSMAYAPSRQPTTTLATRVIDLLKKRIDRRQLNAK